MDESFKTCFFQARHSLNSGANDKEFDLGNKNFLNGKFTKP